MSAPALVPPVMTAPEPEPERVLRNADGSVVVRLLEPVTFDGEKITRVTLPALRGRHMRSAPMFDEGITLGDLIEWASKVVQPAGIVDELSPGDCITLAEELATSVGKSRPPGAGKSRT